MGAIERYFDVANTKKNRIFRFWREYGAVFDHIADDTTVRVVVLSSAVNKAFSAGIDRA